MEPAGQAGPSSTEQITTDASSNNAPAEETKPAVIDTPKLSKGVENAKKRLRAFSIQKKTPIVPIIVPKPTSIGHATVLIGKLNGVKPSIPKVEDEQKKLPKPPKPGANKKASQDSYIDLQKRTLAEIEDMKRKMELVELGIPLGLICPTSNSEKAMPTKAMPPIKHFLGSRFRVCNVNINKGNVNRNKKKTNPAKVDEIIQEAKQARDEGRKYKFDYQKLLPKYDNPFQRKKDEDKHKNTKDFDRDKKKNDRYEPRRYSDHRRDDRDRYKYKDKEKSKEKMKDRNIETEESKKHPEKETEKETNVDLNDYLVCDSWSLDNEEKASSPKAEDKTTKPTIKQTLETKYAKAVTEQVRDSVLKNQDKLKEYTRDSPVRPKKIEKLQPVIDSFKFEIDSNDDEMLDIFDVDSGIEKYARKTRGPSIYSPTDLKSLDFDQDTSKDVSIEDANDDTFLESIINEIKQEDINEDISQDKGLVEYDISPMKDEADSLKEKSTRLSITPELDDKMRNIQSQRNNYTDGYRSSESGYKTSDTTESGYKSMDNFRLSMEKELDESMEAKISKSTVHSLETWSFVLKICQPILFRHDKNNCYRETRTEPKVWYTENPRLCACVKDRTVVYEELQMCKMNLVDRVYGCDQIPDAPATKCRNWYPRPHLCLTETHTVPVSNEWEGEDMTQNDVCRQEDNRRRSNTPLRSEEVLLDREYQRFMKAVWPEVAETRNETPRSTTPVKEVTKKKKDVEVEKEIEAKKPAKKMKQLSSEGWSQESDVEEEDKSKKMKMDKEKLRKRKRSLSSLSSDSEPDARKRKKMLKKKALKKTKSKSAKKRRIGKKILKKLKEKEKKKKKQSKIEKIDDSEDDDSDIRSSKKSKKRKQQKQKTNLKRKKKEESSSSSSTSSSETSTDEAEKKAKKSKKAEAKKKEKKRKRKSSSDSAQSDELFDVNILNNIKTERLTDDEKTKSLLDFSPRRQQKPREIINVKELQNDFVGNNIHIKKEEIEKPKQPTDYLIRDGDEDSCKVTEVIEDEEKEQIEEKETHVPEISSPITILQKSPTVSETTTPQKVPVPIQTISPTIPLRPSVPHPAQIKPVLDESNMSLCSSQESICSVKAYEKDDSHLRPSSQNSNYSFNDVITASQTGLYMKPVEAVVECEDKFPETYQQDHYEMYEHLAMAYQSDVAGSHASPPSLGGEQRIETVVRARSRGEIKCDWRAGLSPAVRPPTPRPSRWGLKPAEVNIVLTGGEAPAQAAGPASRHQQEQQRQRPQPKTTPLPSPQPVYRIQSLANRTDMGSGVTNGYDEAYMDMYGASDRLQYGDCFSEGAAQGSADGQGSPGSKSEARVSTLDARIDHALKNTVLGEVAKEDSPPDPEKDVPEKGILMSGAAGAAGEAGRGAKRVSFADGYKPGQDSDVEEPPVKKRRKVRRVGCAWPCPASHPDHVALWDALPPPPPPPGSPPPRAAHPPPLHLLRAPPRAHPSALALPPSLTPALHKLDTNSTLPMFIPSEPPPALIRFP